MKIVVIIPARYSSTRFPGKVVASIAGKPMIRRVWERAKKARGVTEVAVATDDPRVADVVSEFGHVIMTRADHRSGTERCAEAAEKMAADVVVNLQGDEPIINPESIELVISPFLDDDTMPMATLKHPIESYEDYVNPNVVKVVCDEQQNALYFSRSPLPFYREGTDLIERWRNQGKRPSELSPVPMKHIGIYAYRSQFLQALANMPGAELEQAELLEQLRVLSWGFRIKAVTTPHDSVGVDVPGDVQKVEDIIKQSSNL